MSATQLVLNLLVDLYILGQPFSSSRFSASKVLPEL